MNPIKGTLPELSHAIIEVNNILSESVEVNNILSESPDNYRVVATNRQLNTPVFLKLIYPKNGMKYSLIRDIGCIYLVHLGKGNLTDLPVETIAKTTDEVIKLILNRITLFFEGEARRDEAYIEKNYS